MEEGMLGVRNYRGKVKEVFFDVVRGVWFL